MAEGIYDQELENRILKIVVKITKQRNRPCYQNVFLLLKRGGHELEESELKEFITGLLARGILVNKGGPESESFRLGENVLAEDGKVTSVDDNEKEHGDDVFSDSEGTLEKLLISNSSVDEYVNGSELFRLGEGVLVVDEKVTSVFDNEKKHGDDVFSYSEGTLEKPLNSNSSVNEYINEKFYETLINRIKLEVNKCVETKLSERNCLSVQNTLNDSVQISSDVNGLQIEALNKEVKSLRDELKSKDIIIKTKDIIINTLKNCENNNKDVLNASSGKVDNKDVNENKRVVVKGANGELKVMVNNGNDSNIPSNINENDVFTKVKRKSTHNRSITIIGDSIVKDIEGFKMKRELPKNEKVYIKSFPGATIEDMGDYVRPTLRREPDLMVLHTGTNDLKSEISAKNIASDIIKLALEMKTETNDVMISSITSRVDSLNMKAMEVNRMVKAECSEYNLFFIDNSNISSNKDLNGSGLHLNYKGTVKLANNFLSSIRI